MKLPDILSLLKLDRKKFDEFKTRFYRIQGWDTATGYPTRTALEPLGLGYVVDELEKNGKLGGKLKSVIPTRTV